MITDDERREVAARLRGIKDTREMVEHDMCCNLWSAIFESGYRCTGLCDECEVAVLDSLADLIEPSCDRDTLLALADEMQCDGADAMDDDDWCKPLLYEYAARIRESLGVADA